MTDICVLEAVAVCWSIVVKEEPNISSHLTVSLRRRGMLMYDSLFTVGIPVNYISEYRDVFEATVYIFGATVQNSFFRSTGSPVIIYPF